MHTSARASDRSFLSRRQGSVMRSCCLWLLRSRNCWRTRISSIYCVRRDSQRCRSICPRSWTRSKGGRMSEAKIGFELQKLRLALADLLPVKQYKNPEENIERYRTIRDSIKVVGLIE